MTDDELIERYIDWKRYDRADARLRGRGTHVWAIVGQLRVARGDVTEVAKDYEVPAEAIQAALAYYQRNKEYIDARLLLNSA
jgi:uncharacterized protein (DUF433 family)